MALPVVVAQVDNPPLQSCVKVDCKVVTVPYFVEREFVVPHPIVGIIWILEYGFNPLLLVSGVLDQ